MKKTRKNRTKDRSQLKQKKKQQRKLLKENPGTKGVEERSKSLHQKKERNKIREKSTPRDWAVKTRRALKRVRTLGK